MPIGKRYLIHIKLQLKDRHKHQISETVTKIIKALEDQVISASDYKLAYSSADTGSIGILIRTSASANSLRNKLQNAGEDDMRKVILLGNDGLFIVEIGNDLYISDEFSGARTWLQHH